MAAISPTRQFFDACLRLGIPEDKARKLFSVAQSLDLNADDPIIAFILIFGLINQALEHQRSITERFPAQLSSAVSNLLNSINADVRSASADAATEATRHLALTLSSEVRDLARKQRRRHIWMWVALTFSVLVLSFALGHAIGTSGSDAGDWQQIIGANPKLPSMFTACARTAGTSNAAGRGCTVVLSMAPIRHPSWMELVSDVWSRHSQVVLMVLCLATGWATCRILPKLKGAWKWRS